ncbi:ABC transporter permease [Candidatus Avoscillospira sp. LCP25S3_F1]|uniref:ABC transporter permease n=1 Tax=Candidatus Avoscillospira sp. LCP25S3_F1 TaxID=3438825 RepID=UPI003F92DC3D
MNLRQSFKMSMQSLMSNKGRAFLTMLGIIIGVAAVMIMVSVVQGQNKMTKELYEAQGTNKISVSATSYTGLDLTEDLYEYCLSLSDYVAGVTPNGSVYGNPVKYMSANTENNKKMGSPNLYLGSDQYSICNNFTIAQGRDLSYLDVKRYNKVIVLGSKLKEYLFQAENPIGKYVAVGSQYYKVIGVYAPIGGDVKGKNAQSFDYINYMGVMPYTTGRFLNNYSMSSDFTVKAKDRASITMAVTQITGFLKGKISQNTGYFNVYSPDTWQQQEEKQNTMMSLVLGGIAGISLLVGGIGIMNIMLVTVTERTREIGIRKAIGGSRRSIITQFLIEASVLCGVGGFLGVAVGFLGTVIAGKLMLQMLLLPSIPMTLGAVAFSVLMGVGFGMYPAVKASGLQPVEALRAD